MFIPDSRVHLFQLHLLSAVPHGQVDEASPNLIGPTCREGGRGKRERKRREREAERERDRETDRERERERGQMTFT